jgi:tetratricopeptide (TPR) repeat protein
MAYRGEASPGPTCYRHPVDAARNTCSRCARALCQQCELFDSAAPHCPDCSRALRRRRQWTRAGWAAAALMLIASALALVATHVPKLKPVHVFGLLPSAVEGYRDQLLVLGNVLEREPCSRRHAVEHAEITLRLGDPRRVLQDTDRFVVACGDFKPLHYLRHVAHESLGEHRQAIEEVSAWMAAEPRDRDYPWWRGDAYRHAGDLEQAAADYRQALAMQPGRRGVADDLARVEAALAVKR